MGIETVVIAPWSPWQSPHVERLIGSISRDLLDHVIVFNEWHLLRLLKSYLDGDYHLVRCLEWPEIRQAGLGRQWPLGLAELAGEAVIRIPHARGVYTCMSERYGASPSRRQSDVLSSRPCP